MDALVAAGQTTQADLVDVVNASPEAVTAAVERLVDLALVWEATGGLRAVGGVAELGRGIAQGAGLGGLRPFTPDGPGQDEVAALLAVHDAAALADLVAAWPDATAARVREGFTAYGCCTVTDPVGELADLGLLTRP